MHTDLQMGNLTRALGHNRRRPSPALRRGNGAHGQVVWSGFSGMVRCCDHEIASSFNAIDNIGQIGQALVTTYMLSRGIRGTCL
jgi:hypothetical protein